MPNMHVYLPGKFTKEQYARQIPSLAPDGYVPHDFESFMLIFRMACQEAVVDAYNAANGLGPSDAISPEDGTVRFFWESPYDIGTSDVHFFAFFGKEGLGRKQMGRAIDALRAKLNAQALLIATIANGCSSNPAGLVDYEFANIRTRGLRSRPDIVSKVWGLAEE